MEAEGGRMSCMSMGSCDGFHSKNHVVVIIVI